MRKNAELKIFDVRIDNLTCDDIERTVDGFLQKHGIYHITTVNPEFLLEAQNNAMFYSTLNDATLSVTDGCGISFAAWMKGQRVKCRYPGADLMNRIIQRAVDVYDMPIYILTREDGLSSYQLIKSALLKKYPHAKIFGQDHGLDDDVTIDVGRCVLLCNYGAPFQEIALKAILERSSHKHIIAMGVGGSLDYLSGKIRRAPAWIRGIGMEWFYRLLQQPHRWRRIYNAVIIFPISVIRNMKQ